MAWEGTAAFGSRLVKPEQPISDLVKDVSDSQRERFAGFKWPAFPTYQPFRVRNQCFHDTMVNWNVVCDIARNLRVMRCQLEAPVGYGHSHMIRRIAFTDDVYWVIRLAMPDICRDASTNYAPSKDYWSQEKALDMQSEIDTMCYIAEHTSIPVPKIFAYDTTANNSVGAPYMFMECVFGNSLRDMGRIVPARYEATFKKRLARIQVKETRE